MMSADICVRLYDRKVMSCGIRHNGVATSEKGARHRSSVYHARARMYDAHEKVQRQKPVGVVECREPTVECQLFASGPGRQMTSNDFRTVGG